MYVNTVDVYIYFQKLQLIEDFALESCWLLASPPTLS
jgi:hypothetical protein